MRVFFAVFDGGMALCQLLLGIWFYAARGGTSADGDAPAPETQAKRSARRLYRRYGRRMMLWSIPFLAAVPLDLWKPGAGCIPAWLVYLVLVIWHVVDVTRYSKGLAGKDKGAAQDAPRGE